jgi:pimeloyl-ACP methyl ester carboxylesterase
MSVFALISCLFWMVNTSSSGNESTWRGFKKKDILIAGRNALIVYPEKAEKGKPWIWRTEFFDHEPQADSVLVSKGYHLVYIDVQNMYGAPKAINIMYQFYSYLVNKENLHRKPVLEGFSRGGLFAMNWAATHPDKTGCIYLDAPVCDFKIWPGKLSDFTNDWNMLKEAYGFNSDEEAFSYPYNPLDNLAPLVPYQIPILSVCGTEDVLVPIEKNSGEMKSRYEAMGGKMTIIAKEGVGHHPHSLKDPTPIVEFILKNRLRK